jgi:hypothetical protein
MNYAQYHLSHFQGPRMVALSEGNGSGTKLFQSLLDGHPQILMVPGYPLMYFYPFWEHFIAPVAGLSWPQVLDQLLLRFAPVFDTRINPGSEDLDKLGENQDQYLSIDIDHFSTAFLAMVEGLPVQSRHGLLAFHYAYALAAGDDPAQKQVLIYHIHVFDYVKRYLWADFPDLLVIASVRDPRPNLSRRELNSIVKPNRLKFRESDALLMTPRAYRQATKFLLNGLDALACVPLENCRVFKHEDLALRLDGVMRNTAAFLGIGFDPALLRPSFASMEWKTSFYDFDTSHLVNPEVLKDDWRQKEAPCDTLVIEGINMDYLAKYGYAPCVHYRDTAAGRLRLLAALMRPARLENKRLGEVFGPEGMSKFFRALGQEADKLDQLTSYRNNLFYVLKWTNDGIDFSRPRLFETLLGDARHTTPWRHKLARWAYLAGGGARYAYVLLRTPWERLLRIAYCCQALWRRFEGRRHLPDAL